MEEPDMLDFEQCWAALERRDAGADAEFFYGVRTTGVYCPAGLHVAAAAAQKHDVLRDDGGGGGRRLAALQALPAD
jgi:hypothetical protein